MHTDPVDSGLVAADTYSSAIVAASALLEGKNVEQAAARAKVDPRTLRKWRTQSWWPLAEQQAEADFRQQALGKSLRLLTDKVDDGDVPSAMFLAKLLLVEIPRVQAAQRAPAMATGHGQRASMAQTAAQTHDITPEAAKLALDIMESK